MIKNALMWIFKTIFKTILFIVILIVIIPAITIGIMNMYNKNNTQIINPETTINMTFDEDISEDGSQEFNITQLTNLNFDTEKNTLLDYVNALKFAKTDKRISGISINLDRWQISMDHNTEIKKALQEFKTSGKYIYSYGTSIDNKNYSIATYSDSIFMINSASSHIMLKGYFSSTSYYKDLMDKFGVKVNVIHIGDYKGAGENYNKSKMSNEMRNELLKIYDDIYENMINEFSHNRNINHKTFSNNFWNGKMVMITPQEAKNMNIIDGFINDGDMKNKFISNNEISFSDYTSTVKNNIINNSSDPSVAVLYAEGNIVMSNQQSSISGGGKSISPTSIEKSVDKILKNDKIKAVVLRVNSPGGSSLASEIILQKLKKIKNKMPLVVSMGAVAASGGYYISSNADHIIASPSTITGSIGVVSMIPNLTGLHKMAGVNVEYVKKGKFSNLLSLNTDFTEDKKQLLKNSMQNVYREFKNRVSVGRNIDLQSLEEIAQGKIWTAGQALNNKLIDQIGNLDDAITKAAELANLEKYNTMEFPKNTDILSQILNIETSLMSMIPKNAQIIIENINQINHLKKQAYKPQLLMPLEFNK